jgi:hypothetical protein
VIKLLREGMISYGHGRSASMGAARARTSREVIDGQALSTTAPLNF